MRLHPMKRLKSAIKEDVIAFLFLCFLVGAAFIWVGAAYGWLHLSDADKINATVLWLTALAIFWYAYETYQLKISTSSQADIQEVIMQNEFLPILEPVSGRALAGLAKTGRFTNFQMRNLGRGPAKYIELHVGSVRIPLTWSLAGGEHEAVLLPLAARREVATALKTSPASVRLRVAYQDIYKRTFQTEHIVFDRQRNGSYQLRSGTWDFKRVRT